MQHKPFSIRQRLRSFQYAFNGLKILTIEEHNARIHLAATVVVILISVYFKITRFEWMAVLLCIGLVWIAEAFNSAIENLADLVCAEQHPTIKKIKDLSAGAVLVAASMALVIGLVVFLPYLMKLF